jgi:hypothetical protein
MRKFALAGAVAASGLVLSACTALDLSQLKIADFEGISTCTAPAAGPPVNLPPPAAAVAGGAALPVQDDDIPFALPALSDVGRSTRDAKMAFALAAPATAGGAVATPVRARTDFQIFNDTTTRIIDRKVPVELRGDPVVEGIRQAIVKATAQAHLKRVQALGGNVPPRQAQEVAAAPAGTLTHDQLKSFSRKLFNSGLRPTIRANGVYNAQPVAAPARGSALLAAPVATAAAGVPASITNSTIAAYFAAYYEGKFVDRLGQGIAKPQISFNSLPISLTITDAQIAAVETVLIEYIADLVDPTPVMGDASSKDEIVAGTTKFFPAGTTAQPTAIVTGLADYRRVPPDGCGITQKNAILLSDIANATGDNAALLGGLTSQSFGGVSIGLGVFGKISIGDNQTLGNVVKTGASRIGQRIGYAGAYWLMLTLTNSDAQPAPGNAAPDAVVGGAAPPAVIEMK